MNDLTEINYKLGAKLRLQTFAFYLKTVFSSWLIDLTAIDYYYFANRFLLVYNFLRVKSDNLISRSFLNFAVNEFSVVETLSDTYMSAVWLEREVWDMFGVIFLTSDLRRILTDYGFDGHPLRKDYPLSGFFELWYAIDKKCMDNKPLELAQEYRYFELLNPWINVT